MTSRRRSLTTRIVGSLLLVSALATALAGGFAYIGASSLLEQSIRDRLEMVVTLKQDELRRLIVRQRESVIAFGRLPDVRRQSTALVRSGSAEERASAKAQLATVFQTTSLSDLGWREVLILDSTGGRVVFSTNTRHEGDFRYIDEFFKRGREATAIQPVHPSPVTLEPTLTISTPIAGAAADDVLAVLAVNLSLEWLDDVIAGGAKLGTSGETYLVDRYNSFVESKHFGRTGFPRGVHTEGIDAAVRGENGNGRYLNYAGVPVVGVYLWLQEFGLAMIAEVHQSEAYAPARQLGLRIGGIGLTVALISMLGFYLLARRITRPILSIERAATAVAGGDLNAEAPVSTSDEIGVLARSFNAMTARLRGMVVERVEMERQLFHSQKLESLGVLAGGVAHDFNNILMAIRGNLDLAIDDVAPDSGARQSLDLACQAVSRATDLTRQMLAYSGRGTFVVRELRLSQLVSECAQLFRISIPRTIEFDLRLRDDQSAIRADAGQVEQVVMNLVTNAAEAIGPKPGTITLSTGVTDASAEDLKATRIEPVEPGRFAWVECRDTGCGMDEATLSRMFEPFFTTKKTGRGLGMAAMLGIVRGHRGAIFVDSQPSVGTRIRVLFPTAGDGSGAAAGEATTSTSMSASSALIAGTVLVVDDEEEIRSVTSRLVARLGFKVATATDGLDAVAFVRDHGEDLVCVLLDLTMPRMDGREAFRQLSAMRPKLPIVLCSGFDEQATTQEWSAQGFAAFIQKPYSAPVLRDTLLRVLESSGG